jgi:hypothetical protein
MTANQYAETGQGTSQSVPHGGKHGVLEQSATESCQSVANHATKICGPSGHNPPSKPAARRSATQIVPPLRLSSHSDRHATQIFPVFRSPRHSDRPPLKSTPPLRLSRHSDRPGTQITHGSLLRSRQGHLHALSLPGQSIEVPSVCQALSLPGQANQSAPHVSSARCNGSVEDRILRIVQLVCAQQLGISATCPPNVQWMIYSDCYLHRQEKEVCSVEHACLQALKPLTLVPLP